MNTPKEEFLQSVCQCCLEEVEYRGDYNFLTSNGSISSSPISYIEMLSSCFSLNLEVPLSNFEQSYICDLCIIRLKDAFAFRSQVKEAQKALQNTEQTKEKCVKFESFDCDQIENENASSEDVWDVEYLDEYEDIINNPFRKASPAKSSASDNSATGNRTKDTGKREYGHFNRSIVDRECDGRYTRSRWLGILKKKICKARKQCLVCNEKFPNVQTLNRHLNVHYPVCTCKYCGKSFASRERIESHLLVHNVGPYKCKVCNKVMDTKSKWSNHITIHKSNLRHCCPLCPERFKDFLQRAKHLATKHDHPEKPFLCKICGMAFRMAVYLSQHKRRVHLKERNTVCTMCGKTFFGAETLGRHMITHGGERKHECKVCNKAYARLRTLKEHTKIHTNEKRFVCRICDRSFTQKCTLKGHMRTHGKDLNNFEETQKMDGKSGLIYVFMDHKAKMESP